MNHICHWYIAMYPMYKYMITPIKIKMFYRMDKYFYTVFLSISISYLIYIIIIIYIYKKTNINIKEIRFRKSSLSIKKWQIKIHKFVRFNGYIPKTYYWSTPSCSCVFISNKGNVNSKEHIWIYQEETKLHH